jgi:hypothetical protein
VGETTGSIIVNPYVDETATLQVNGLTSVKE